MSGKRTDYISWDEYFMGIAQLSAMRSKDPNTQVGACIVSQENKILSMGYNGFPKGCDDDEYPWNREGDLCDSKYAYVTHSELNAILNYRGGSLEGTKLYVTLFPCNGVRQGDHSGGNRRTGLRGMINIMGHRRIWHPDGCLPLQGVKMTPYRSNGRILELKV